MWGCFDPTHSTGVSPMANLDQCHLTTVVLRVCYLQFYIAISESISLRTCVFSTGNSQFDDTINLKMDRWRNLLGDKTSTHTLLLYIKLPKSLPYHCCQCKLITNSVMFILMKKWKMELSNGRTRIMRQSFSSKGNYLNMFEADGASKSLQLE